MQRTIVILLLTALFIFSGTIGAVAQKKSKVHIKHADSFKYDERRSKDIQMLIGHVVMRQDSTYFYCDSAFLNTQTNSFEAFGKVHIDVNDTVDLYGDRLHYEGKTKIAELHNNVRLVDNNTILTTEHLVYNRISKMAFYDVGGHIVNKDNTLSSQRGYYDTKSRIFYFRKDVELINPDSETYSDTLTYNTNNETAYFHGPTVIRGTESTIYCEEGWYDTKNDVSKLVRRPSISNAGQTISADSLLYDNQSFFGRAFGHVQIHDTLRNIIIKGRLGEMWDDKGVSYVTDRAVAVTYDENDSLFIHADTMWMHFDDKRDAKSMYAYNNVRFYRKDFQGKCDSLVYKISDSTIRMYKSPTLWSKVNQLTADSIFVVTVNNRIDSLIMFNTAFIISQDSTETYNQIKGKNMVGYFRNNEIYKILVDGNAQTVYYIREEDGYLIGINVAESSTMEIRFKSSEIQNLSYQTQASENMYPEKDLPPEQRQLKGFSWQHKERPLGKWDIFRKPGEEPED